ncbi:hypothetical protein [uncultured Paraglaciecola sp.]|uniref:portal protein n=1 Tax=uncultured Paraglaciecola sp. TaxID=1765024 RepID=UPI00261667AD|nr:hypothetical protein [uncultured Paraglaciecola sp.]
MTKEKSKSESKKLDSIKENIEESFAYFEDNIEQYKRLMRFAYKTTITDKERQNLSKINKPDIELNYTSSYLSKVVGEFSRQAPEVSVSGNGSGSQINVLTTDVIEGHMMHVFLEYEKSGKNTVIKQQCGGSYSAFKVIAEYDNKMSFTQKMSIINVEPTMCFFDPMSKKTAKDDSNYWGEIYPIEKEEFKRQYPKYASEADRMGYSKALNNKFSWTYKNGNKDIIMLADYYCLEKKRKQIHRLSDGQVVLNSEYEEMIENWSELYAAPEIVESREEDFNKVIRYIIFGNSIIKKEDTPYESSNYFFVAGDCAQVYESDSGNQVSQSLKSYISNAVGAQKLLNYTAQTLANFSENLMQQKYMLEKRSVVNKKDWLNPQKASVLLYSSESDEGSPLPAPKEVVQQDIPQSIMGTFVGMPQVIQSTLGYSDPRVNANEVSGEALDKSSIDNNVMAMPFKANYMEALSAAGDFMLKIFPKLYVTPMTIPVINEKGERVFVPINQQLSDGSKDPQSIFFDYKDNELGVTIKSSYSFTLQKDRALKTMTQLMGAVPSFGELMNRRGLPIIVDNLDIRGADKLKEMADKQIQEEQSQQNQPNPAQQQLMIKQQELQLKQQKIQMEYKVKQEELQEQKNQMALDEKLAMIGLEKELMNASVQNEKVQAEIKTANIDAAVKVANQALAHEEHLLNRNEQQHNHTIDVMSLNSQ